MSAASRRAAPPNARKGKPVVVENSGPSLIARMLGWVPLTEAQLHAVFLALFLAAALALAGWVAIVAGLPGVVAAKIAQVSARAGFEVRHVEVRGVTHMDQARVFERVLGQRDQAMTQVDLAAVRRDLLALDWVADARVSRQLPDALVVDIVERVPHAVTRLPGGRLMLIDAGGHPLEPIAPDKVGRMLIVSGPGGQARVAEIERLLDVAPALRPRVREAEWIGNRRWNLTFRTGQVLALPEADDSSDNVAAKAVMAFARLDGTNRLLGGRIAAFDMRAPDRLYMRIPGHAQELAQQAAAAARAAHDQETP